MTERSKLTLVTPFTPAGHMAHKMAALVERMECGAWHEGSDERSFVTLLVPPAIAEVVSNFRVDTLEGWPVER